MNKINLEIVGLSYSQTQSGAYVLVLGETEGTRRLPIVIGGFEAQAIAIGLEKMTPSRPLTHDLFITFAETFKINITEVIIYNLTEGVFYSKIICNNGNEDFEIDSRTSDAIAIAVRFKCPISTYEFVLKNDRNVTDTNSISENQETDQGADYSDLTKSDNSNDFINKSSEELKNMLQGAIDDEQYELASRIRDELNQRKKS